MGHSPDCAIPDHAECMFRPRFLPVLDGELQEIQSRPQQPPPLDLRPEWAKGLNIKTATGWQWYLLLQHAGDDRERLRQIQAARGYKPGWVFYTAQDAAAKLAARP
jgi:hypothetical protein